MAPGKQNKAEKLKTDAIKAIEKVAESKESGELLINQLSEAHDSLDRAISEAQSPEEELSLKLALRDIQSLESVLAERGKKEKLTPKQKKELQDLSEELCLKVDSLDVLIDVVKFRDDFYKQISGRNKLLANLDEQVSPTEVSIIFESTAQDVLAASEELRDQYYKYFGDLHAQFDYGEIPQEIQAEFDKMFADLDTVDRSDTLVKNSLEFAAWENELKETTPSLDHAKTLHQRFLSLKEEGVIKPLEPLLDLRLNQLEWTLNIRKNEAEEEQYIVKAEDLEKSLSNLEQNGASMSANDFNVELDWIVNNLVLVDSVEYPTSPAFYETLIVLVNRRANADHKNKDLSKKAQLHSVLGVLYALLAECRSNLGDTERAEDALKISDENLEMGRTLVLIFQIQEVNKTVKIKHLSPQSPLQKFIKTREIEITKDGDFVFHSCSPEGIEELHGLMTAQFALEDIYNTEEKLLALDESARDEFYEASLLLVQVQKAFALDDYDLTRALGIKFMRSIDGKNNLPEDLEAGIRQVTAILSGFEIKSLRRLSVVAKHLFGTDEDYKEFLDGVLISIGQEIARLEEGNAADFAINFASLQRRHFSEPRPSYHEGAVISADNRSGLQEYQDEKIANQKIAEDETKMMETTPNKSAIDLWNRVVKIECDPDPDTIGDVNKRKSLYQELGDEFRTKKGSGYYVKGKDFFGSKGQKYKFHEEDPLYSAGVAGMYYRLSLGDKMQEAESKMEDIRIAKKAALEKKKEKYRGKAMDMVEEMLEEANKDVVFAGKNVSDAEFEKWKTALSSEGAIDAFAENLMDEYVNRDMEKLIFGSFEYGKTLSGIDAETWAKLEDMEGIFDSWSDETARFISQELVKTAFIVIASMGVGLIFEAGAEVIALATFGIRAAQLSRTANIIYRAYLYGSKITGFTTSERALTRMIGDKNPIGFGTNFGVNLLTFIAVDTGGALWTKVLGRYLVGEKVAAKILFPIERMQGQMVYSPLFKEAGQWGKRGLKFADFAGKSGTSVEILTAMQAGQELAAGKDLEDMNLRKMQAKNLAIVLAIHGGQMLFTPVLRPMTEKIDTRRTRMIEDVDPSYFLENRGLKPEFFEKSDATVEKPVEGDLQAQRLYEARVAEARVAAMDELRTFMDRHGISGRFFEGRTAEQIDEVMRQVNDFTKAHEKGGLSELPTRDELMDLYGRNKEAFVIIVAKLHELPLELKDVQRIYKDDPNIILFFSEKIPRFREWLRERVISEARALIKSRNATPADVERAEQIEETATGSREVFRDSLVELLLSGRDGFESGLVIIAQLTHLTLSADQVLYITSNLPEAVREKFLKACIEKMSPLDRFLLEDAILDAEKRGGDDRVLPQAETVSDTSSGGPTVLSAMRRHHGFVRNALASAGLVLALAGAEPIFEAKPQKPVPALVEGFDKLPEATESSGRLMFSMENPGKVKDSTGALSEKWEGKSQSELCDLMHELGLPNDLINSARVNYEHLPAELKPYVRLIGDLDDENDINLYVVVDRSGLTTEFGLDNQELEDILKMAGVLAPENIEELAKYTGIPKKVLEDFKPPMQAGILIPGIGLTWNIIAFLFGVLPAWWAAQLGWKALKYGAKKIGGKKTTTGGGETPPPGPDGKEPKVEAKEVSFPALDALMTKLGYPDFRTKLEDTQLTELQVKFNELQTLLRNGLYNSPETTILKVFEILVEIEYIELRLVQINGSRGGGPAESTIKRIQRQIEQTRDDLDGKRSETAIKRDLDKAKTAGDKATFAAELKERRELERKLTVLEKKLADGKTDDSDTERDNLVKRLDQIYNDLFNSATGIVNVTKGSRARVPVSGKLGKWRLKKGAIGGTVERDLGPTTDLDPAEIPSALKTLRELIIETRLGEKLRRLKEIDLSILLGRKKYDRLRPIADANDPANPETEAAKAYKDFYDKLVKEQEKLKDDTDGIWDNIRRNRVGRFILEHPMGSAITAIILIILGITAVKTWWPSNPEEDEQPGGNTAPVSGPQTPGQVERNRNANEADKIMEEGDDSDLHRKIQERLKLRQQGGEGTPKGKPESKKGEGPKEPGVIDKIGESIGSAWNSVVGDEENEEVVETQKPAGTSAQAPAESKPVEPSAASQAAPSTGATMPSSVGDYKAAKIRAALEAQRKAQEAKKK